MRFLLYKINEVFETIQGEASFTGTPSIFLRLQGCPVGCSWCDTKQTWDVDNVYKVSLDDTVEKKADSDHWAESDDSCRNNGKRGSGRHTENIGTCQRVVNNALQNDSGNG